jgi:hypothetical protein
MTSEKCRYYITDGEVWNVTSAQILRRITISQCRGAGWGGRIGSERLCGSEAELERKRTGDKADDAFRKTWSS